MFDRIKNAFAMFFRRVPGPDKALSLFQKQRQILQQDFFRHAAASGKPRGLRWTQCDWLDNYALAEDTGKDCYTLFCGVNVSFEAVEGGDMEHVEAVSMIRDGSALFHLQNGRWGSGGRVLFNMPPDLAARTFTGHEPVRSA